jgi:hypothetical protein
MQMIFFRHRKLKKIARELSGTVFSEAWKGVSQLIVESEKAVATLKDPDNGGLVLEGGDVLMALGIHTVDHYSRDFLDEKDRKRLVMKMIRCVLNESTMLSVTRAAETGIRLTAQELKVGEESALKIIQAATNKFEECSVIDLGSPEYRGDSGHTSVTWCGMLLMGNFATDDDVPDDNLQQWDDMDRDLLMLYDSARAIAWDIHQRLNVDLHRLLKERGFQQIRNLGADMIV